MLYHRLAVPVLALAAAAFATPIIYDGRAPYNYTGDNLDGSVDPYLSVVKGSTENATYYTTLLGRTLDPTPLWNAYVDPASPLLSHHAHAYAYPIEQPMTIAIDNTSIFVPGRSPAQPQYGLRRTELIAQKDGNHTALNDIADVGTTVFHVSIRADDQCPLNASHEYQIVWIEPADGSHVFEIQLGSPFTNPTRPLPVADAHYLKVRNHALALLFETPFSSGDWHNVAIQVDWTHLTLGVFYSVNEAPLEAVTGVEDNASAPAGARGRGDYHFGVLKLPLVDPSEPASERADVVHYGIQEGDQETLTYSGVFIESVEEGVSVGAWKARSSYRSANGPPSS